MDSPNTGAQLLAYNLQFLLRYLSAETLPVPALAEPVTAGGGALSLLAPAEKRGEVS